MVRADLEGHPEAAALIDDGEAGNKNPRRAAKGMQGLCVLGKMVRGKLSLGVAPRTHKDTKRCK